MWKPVSPGDTRSTESPPASISVSGASAERHAAGHADHFAGDEPTLVAGEKDIRRRELAGLRRPPEGILFPELGDLIGLERLRNQRRPHRTGRDGVDADATFGQLLGEALRERHDRALCRRVIEERRLRLVGIYRGRAEGDA